LLVEQKISICFCILYLLFFLSLNANAVQPQEMEDPLSSSPYTNIFTYPNLNFGIDFGYESFRLAATDRTLGLTSIYMSKKNPMGRLHWLINFNENWTLQICFNYFSEKIMADPNPNASVLNSKVIGYEYLLGLIHNWNETFRSGIKLVNAPRVFATSSSNVDIDKVQTYELKIDSEKDFVNDGLFSAGMGAAIFAINSANTTNYSAGIGAGADLTAYMKFEITKNNYQFTESNVDLKFEILYGGTKQNTTLMKQSEQRAGVFIGLSKTL